MISNAIKLVVEGKDLSKETCESAVRDIMRGKASEAEIAALLVGLRIKGETVEEITAFARVMREFCERIEPNVEGTLVDTCGTGGNAMKTFNISTLSAFVAAGASVPIAKHGNRSVTSKCGSADVLEALGVNIELGPEQVRDCIEEIGIGFMYAPLFHPAMKHVMPARKKLGIRTVFNILGPLTNPASARAQVIGVYSRELVEKIASVLKNLGVGRALVVHGSGMDELSTIRETFVAEINGEVVETYSIKPEDFGFSKPSVDELSVKDVHEAKRVFNDVLNGTDSPKKDIVLLNAAAAIYVGGNAESIESAIRIAEKSIDSGSALEKLNRLINFGGN